MTPGLLAKIIDVQPHDYSVNLVNCKSMLEYYRLRIKKEYAAAVIEDLEKMKAIEVISEDADVYEWQKKEVRKRAKQLQKNPETAIGWKEAEKKIKSLGK